MYLNQGLLQGMRTHKDGHPIAQSHKCDISKKRLIKSFQDFKNQKSPDSTSINQSVGLTPYLGLSITNLGKVKRKFFLVLHIVVTHRKQPLNQRSTGQSGRFVGTGVRATFLYSWSSQQPDTHQS